MNREYKLEVLDKVDAKTITEITSLLIQLNPDFNPPVRIKDIKRVIDFPEATIFVVRDKNKEIVGMVTLIGYPQIEGMMKVWLEDLVVDKNHRKKGLGKKLVKEALKKARELKKKSVCFTSRLSRKIANKFYKKMGFKLKETNYYRYDL